MSDQDRANRIYGEITAYVHIAGYTFAKASDGLEKLLEGDRWKLGGAFDDVNAFMDSLRFDNLKAAVDQRKRLVARIKELQPDVSNRQIARTLGVAEGTVRNDIAQDCAAPEENVSNSNVENAGGAQNCAPALSGGEVAKLAQRQEAKLESAQRAEQRREASRNAPPLPDGMELRIGDCRIVLADVPDNSVPLILTDPPYPEEAEPLYHWLAEWSARVLIPGGSLICYTGHWSLDRDTAIFSKHLRFWWLLAMMHDQSKRLPGKFIIANFKPVLWYVKDHRRGRSLVPDILKSPARDKTLHNWSQGEGGVSQLVEHLSNPGELILDPFAGTGTWGKIAVGMGRRWIGADVVEGGAEAVIASELSDEKAPNDLKDGDGTDASSAASAAAE